MTIPQCIRGQTLVQLTLVTVCTVNCTQMLTKTITMNELRLLRDSGI